LFVLHANHAVILSDHLYVCTVLRQQKIDFTKNTNTACILRDTKKPINALILLVPSYGATIVYIILVIIAPSARPTESAIYVNSKICVKGTVGHRSHIKQESKLCASFGF
jgi:hypothetical protein